jgi:hypothetical protein
VAGVWSEARQTNTLLQRLLRLGSVKGLVVLQSCLYLSRLSPLLIQEFMMGIASFSPQMGRATGLSILLAPIQAIAALFVPAPSIPVHTRSPVSSAMAYRASAQPHDTRKFAAAMTAQVGHPTAPLQRLKIVRQFEPGTNRSCAGRLVISGRMADVCAELDRMAG